MFGKGEETYVEGLHRVHPLLSAGGWGWTSDQIKISSFRGACWERGGDFFQEREVEVFT